MGMMDYDYEEEEETSETMLDKAILNCNYAHMPWALKPGDTEYLNLMAYNLQQAVELAMKYLLSESGVRYPKSHDIEQLLRIGHEHNVDMHADGYIEEHAEMLSCWEAKARYLLGYKVELRKVQAAMPEVQKYLETIIDLEKNKLDQEIAVTMQSFNNNEQGRSEKETDEAKETEKERQGERCEDYNIEEYEYEDEEELG